jgi:hypothetical protein
MHPTSDDKFKKLVVIGDRVMEVLYEGVASRTFSPIFVGQRPGVDGANHTIKETHGRKFQS